MYEETVLKSAARTLVDRQDHPPHLLEDLRAVKAQHDEQDIPEDMQRFELRLELDANDFSTVLDEVEAIIEGEDEQ